MKTNIKRKLMLLSKYTIFLAITLFSVILISSWNIEAASFRYSDFDWDKFANEKKNYWESICRKDLVDENGVEDCTNKILKSQKKFYVKLYKLLAKYQEKKQLYINDNVILETVFYNLIPSQLSDDSNEYNEDWLTDSGMVHIDGEEVTDEDIEEDDNNIDAATYFETEKDTLKLLIKNMLAYTTKCYGVYGDVTVLELEDGSKREVCEQGVPFDINKVVGRKCADVIGVYELGFWKYHVSKWKHDGNVAQNIAGSILGVAVKDENYETCTANSGSFPSGTVYTYEKGVKVSEQKYFEFLINNRYFDGKQHLQFNFEETVLEPLNRDCMVESLCDNHLTDEEYIEMNSEIVEVRRKIVEDIVFILRNYGIEVDYSDGAIDEFDQSLIEENFRSSYYWPIGSSETEERNGKTFADGTPVSTNVTSYFGPRTHPVTGEKNSFHYGIDIGASKGSNVIAAANGEVFYVNSGCSEGDSDCGGGFGNYIVISHNNGDYTLYAHLDSIHSGISQGTAVEKGQVIGYVGSTGRSTGAHLHFEIRMGGNSVTYSVDPLLYLNVDNPRPTFSDSDFPVRETSLTKEEFVSKIRSFCTSHTKECANLNKYFGSNLEDIYDYSIKYNVNPELVVIRAMNEGFSPATSGVSHNYWGIGCANGKGLSACKSYSSLESGVAGFANTVKKYNSVSEMMAKYSYIGAYWFNDPVIDATGRSTRGSSAGGCYYFPYIRSFMSSSRASTVEAACARATCEYTNGKPNCLATTAEDQKAYQDWQVEKKMGPLRRNMFGI